jgi:NADP-dependent 3-hydroxy acid dehydrogenase YdfG
VQVDVSDRDAVERMVGQVGEVDVLVANAGVSEGHEQRPSWEIDVDELLGRIDEVRERDLNLIRLRR